MNIPKKKRSKLKKRRNKANWRKKILNKIRQSFSLTKSLLRKKRNTFVHNKDNNIKSFTKNKNKEKSTDFDQLDREIAEAYLKYIRLYGKDKTSLN